MSHNTGLHSHSPVVHPPHPNAGQWTATTTHGVDTFRLTVHGVLREPIPGYKLTLMRLTAAGGRPRHTPVDYTQSFVIPKDHVPAQVSTRRFAPQPEALDPRHFGPA